MNFVELTCSLFPVSSDEWNRAAFFEKDRGCSHLPGLDLQFLGDLEDVGFEHWENWETSGKMRLLRAESNAPPRYVVVPQAGSAPDVGAGLGSGIKFCPLSGYR